MRLLLTNGRLHADEHIDVTHVDIPARRARRIRMVGPPGLAAMAACLGAFRDPPAIVVSGINAGLNTGHSVKHSGTVRAALSAENFVSCGDAVSIDPTGRAPAGRGPNPLTRPTRTHSDRLISGCSPRAAWVRKRSSAPVRSR